MPRYEYVVKVECEYYVWVEANSEEEALELAVDANYSVGDLQNFQYSIDAVEDIGDEEMEDDEESEEQQ